MGGDFGFNTAPMMVIGVIILRGTAIRSFWQNEFSKNAIFSKVTPDAEFSRSWEPECDLFRHGFPCNQKDFLACALLGRVFKKLLLSFRTVWDELSVFGSGKARSRHFH
ncbi:MAG: hypothetical protein NTW21_02790 [Verrucomicrobia bacterium]|nr:hypothetical protein [Verrucomicrobiota bacterium]